MKAKYIFTKIGYRKNDLELMDMIFETDEDYDVADIFLTDYYSDEGETVSFEAESLEDAVYQANRWFGSCVTSNNIIVSYDCKVKKTGQFYEDHHRYIPAPIKHSISYQNVDWDRNTNKRARKYYGKKHQNRVYDPEGMVFDYSGYKYYPY